MSTPPGYGPPSGPSGPSPGPPPGPPPGPRPGPYQGPPGPYAYGPGHPPVRPEPPLPGPLAETGDRVVQHLLDLLITAIPGVVLVVLSIALAAVGAAQQSPALAAVGGGLYVLAFLAGLGFGFWLQVMDPARHDGRTWAMRKRGLRIVKLDGSPVTTGDLALRWLLLIVIDGGLIGLIVLATTERRQRLGDMVAKTVVIHDRAGMSGPW